VIALASLTDRKAEPDDGATFACVAASLACSIEDILSQYGVPRPRVSLTDDVTLCRDQWFDRVEPDHAICSYTLHPTAAWAAMAIPAALIAQLVDIFYGGPGKAGNKPRLFTPAELSFLNRFAGDVADAITRAWTDTYPLEVKPDQSTYPHKRSQRAEPAASLRLQNFMLQSEVFGPAQITFAYPQAALDAVHAGKSTTTSGTGPGAAAQWRQQLHQAVLNVHLPVRTIFARTEMTFSDLIGLKTGDVIPICLPKLVPITIDGLAYAQGVVGECNGRTSVRIEKLSQGI
jgi:flagellar motor switch protein FliM